MPETNIFRWLDGRGWLVLSGRLTDDDPAANKGDVGDVRSLVLARSAADGGVACISLAGGAASADALLDALEDLGAPSGYIVDVFAEDDQTLEARLADAGVIVIDSAADGETARSALIGAPKDGIQAAYLNGAMILVEGHSIAAFGEWAIRPDGTLAPALEWLSGAVILPSAVQLADQVREALELEPAAIAVGISEGSALAFGPDGQVEVWGRGQVAVALGTAYATGGDAPASVPPVEAAGSDAAFNDDGSADALEED
ncbi:MAG: hypothetical protein SF162_05140 [bacterium]|nr:hypothetical protein [bacterium]